MTENLIEAVKAHALANYEAGWDVVLETLTDEELAERIGRATSLRGAIAKLRPLVEVANERRPVAGWDY